MPNWLDLVLGLILGVSIFSGFRKGLARTGIGFAAVVLGLLCGFWFYASAGAFFLRFFHSRPLANLAGFLTIFVLVLTLGGLASTILDHVLKFIHLSWLNRLLGAAFGAVRGMLIAAVIVFILLAFPSRPPQAVAHSHIAPYVMGAARAMAYVAPKDIRGGFQRSYEKIKQVWAGITDGQPRKLPAESL